MMNSNFATLMLQNSVIPAFENLGYYKAVRREQE
jgi:hypothetical protein